MAAANCNSFGANFCLADLPPSPANAYDVAQRASDKLWQVSLMKNYPNFKSKMYCDSAINYNDINFCVYAPDFRFLQQTRQSIRKIMIGWKISSNGMISVLRLVFWREKICLADLLPSCLDQLSVQWASDKLWQVSLMKNYPNFKSKMYCDIMWYNDINF